MKWGCLFFALIIGGFQLMDEIKPAKIFCGDMILSIGKTLLFGDGPVSIESYCAIESSTKNH